MKEIASWKSISIIPLIVSVFCFNACTTIQFKSIAPPTPDSKLRVAILPIRGNPGKYGWYMTYKEWSNSLSKSVAVRLRDKGIYEVVPQDDINYAVGTQALTADEYWWLKNDSALIKQLGKTLYADYVLIVIADASRSTIYTYDFKFLNIETGILYSVSDYFTNSGSYERNQEFALTIMFPRMYRKLFSEAKGDLLATAVRKGRLMATDETKKPAAPDSKVALVPPTLTKPVPVPPSIVAEKGLQNKTTIVDKTRLVVHDFNTNEQLQVVSLVLSEALREELFKLGIFSLVNRENLVQVMSELHLQQSGLVDEKQALKLGKWFAANETVTGRFSQLGNSFILQTKRTDITTMSTLGFGTLKCTAGQEEELLAGLPELARKIAGLEK
jgi:hypothetical protein